MSKITDAGGFEGMRQDFDRAYDLVEGANYDAVYDILGKYSWAFQGGAVRVFGPSATTPLVFMCEMDAEMEAFSKLMRAEIAERGLEGDQTEILNGLQVAWQENSPYEGDFVEQLRGVKSPADIVTMVYTANPLARPWQNTPFGCWLDRISDEINRLNSVDVTPERILELRGRVDSLMSFGLEYLDGLQAA